MNLPASKIERYSPVLMHQKARLFEADCFDWLAAQTERTIHAVVTDPPYGLVEYTEKEQRKLRKGQGGVWRIPPSFDGHVRSPLPRFTTLKPRDLEQMADFFLRWGRAVRRVLVPGAHVLVAGNPLVAHIVASALDESGLENRGSVVRLVMTMRGGDRPKNAHTEFPDVSVMPRSMWEPWLLFREPLEGRVQDNLRKWRTGGLRRVSDTQPFGDVISSHPTRRHERELAPHPSLKPQTFLRKVVKAVLPFGEGVVLDTFAGAGSTLAAANAVGYQSVGVELDPRYVKVAVDAIPRLTRLSFSADVSASAPE
jgi:site-specific DNA-methyltransferase (adenine-specific)